MTDLPYRSALIIGAGPGIGSALARSLTGLGVIVSLGARNVEKLATLVEETGARPFTVDVSQAASVAALFDRVSADTGDPEIVIFNAASSLHGPLAELDPVGVQRSIATTAFGGFLAAHHAARTMVPRGRGAILFSGNTASIKGFANSAAFAMGKFALRGLAQSAARELGPKGIHVAHFVIDGFIRAERHPDPVEAPDSTLHSDAIAQTYIDVLCQPRCAWTSEVELRPWVERF